MLEELLELDIGNYKKYEFPNAYFKVERLNHIEFKITLIYFTNYVSKCTVTYSKNQNRLFFANFETNKKERNQGFGSKIIDFVKKFVDNKDINYILLNPKEDLINFYKKRGFLIKSNKPWKDYLYYGNF